MNRSTNFRGLSFYIKMISSCLCGDGSPSTIISPTSASAIVGQHKEIGSFLLKLPPYDHDIQAGENW